MEEPREPDDEEAGTSPPRPVWEDHLLERKVESDLKDLLKTLVAFANSVRPGHTAVVLIGENDNGSVQGVTNPDNIQKTVRETCEKIYPPIVWRSTVYEQNGLSCVRVEIDYDGETPHFGGIAWVRKGSESVKASDEVFQKLIELRLGLTRELEKWIGKSVCLQPDKAEVVHRHAGESSTVILRWPRDSYQATLTSVIAFGRPLRLMASRTRNLLKNSF